MYVIYERVSERVNERVSDLARRGSINSVCVCDWRGRAEQGLDKNKESEGVQGCPFSKLLTLHAQTHTHTHKAESQHVCSHTHTHAHTHTHFLNGVMKGVPP